MAPASGLSVWEISEAADWYLTTEALKAASVDLVNFAIRLRASMTQVEVGIGQGHASEMPRPGTDIPLSEATRLPEWNAPGRRPYPPSVARQVLVQGSLRLRRGRGVRLQADQVGWFRQSRQR